MDHTSFQETANRAAKSLEAGLDQLGRKEPGRTIKRVLVMLVGGTVLLIGVALLVLPGPAFVVIPLGLGILALEFAWARRWLRKARQVLEKQKSEILKRAGSRDSSDST